MNIIGCRAHLSTSTGTQWQCKAWVLQSWLVKLDTTPRVYHPAHLHMYNVFRRCLPTSLCPVQISSSLRPLLEDHEREPSLRLAVLGLIGDALQDDSRASAFGGTPDRARAVLGCLLLPPLVWRAGKVAAAIRYAAVTALGSMLARGLVPSIVLQELVAVSE